jgi:hypothetical protein
MTASWALPLACRDHCRPSHHGRVWIDGPNFKGICSCSWIGQARATRSEADLDAQLHASGFIHVQERLALT